MELGFQRHLADEIRVGGWGHGVSILEKLDESEHRNWNHGFIGR